MTDDQKIEELRGMVEALGGAVEASVELAGALGARVDFLENAFAEFASGDAEDGFMEERQRWIDNCRERAAEKRRTS